MAEELRDGRVIHESLGEGASYRDRSGPRYIVYSQELDGDPTYLITDNLVGWRNPSDESENREKSNG